MEMPKPLTDAPARQAGRERRSHPRQARAELAFLCDSDEPTASGREVLVCDLSLGGVGLRCDFRLAPGALFHLKPAGSPRVSARIRVVASRQNPDLTWSIGARFC